jgi:hypothetical protein
MEVEDGLAALGSVINDDAVAVADLLLADDVANDLEQVSKQGLVLSLGVLQLVQTAAALRH